MPAPVQESAVLTALAAVRDPDLGRDIVSLRFVKNLAIEGGRVRFTIELTTPGMPGEGPDAGPGARGRPAGARRVRGRDRDDRVGALGGNPRRHARGRARARRT